MNKEDENIVKLNTSKLALNDINEYFYARAWKHPNRFLCERICDGDFNSRRSVNRYIIAKECFIQPTCSELHRIKLLISGNVIEHS